MTWKVRPYYNVNPFVGLCWHDSLVTIPLPPFMMPAKLPHIDFDVVQGLWIGSFLSNGKHKKIVSDDLLFVGRMSDAGLVLPHISIPPSWMNILATLFGSSNALFGTSRVTIASKNLLWGNEDCDLATSPFPIAPLSLNLACWDPFSLPSDIVVLWGTVYSGMSLADLLAALIDLAIQWAIEGLMWLGGKALEAGFKRLGKAASKGAAKNAAKKASSSAKKGVFATLGDKIVTTFKKCTGATASEAYEDYLKKAAKTKGIKNALSMSDDDLAKFVKKAGGFSDELGDVAENFSEGYAKFSKKYSKQVKSLTRDAIDGEVAANTALAEIKNVVGDTDIATSIVKHSVLEDALEELDSAVAQVIKEEKIWAFELKLAKKSISTLYKMIVRNGNAFGSGTEGGIFSFDGAGWTNYFARNLQLKDRWSWDLAEDMVGEATDETSSTDDDDDDYWYDETSSEDENDDSSDDDDDYWYDEDSSVSTIQAAG